MNKFLDYVSEEVPKILGVKQQEAIKKIVVMMYEEEIKGAEEFSTKNIPNARERAELALPYQVSNEMTQIREHVIDVIEYCILTHRQLTHGEDHSERMAMLLKTGQYTESETQIMFADFWN